MTSWNDIESITSFSILPEGERVYEITVARAELDSRQLRVANISLSSSAGNGTVNVPLEPWGQDAGSLELWGKVLKGQLEGLGYVPADVSAPFSAAVHLFSTKYLPTLVGKLVIARVEHVLSNKINEKTGEPFINPRVYFNGLMGVHGDAQQGMQPVAAAVGAEDDIVF